MKRLIEYLHVHHVLWGIVISQIWVDLKIFQKSCIDFSIHATPLERYMPEERAGFKYQLWRIVESTAFEYFIMTLIVLNTILLMMKVRNKFDKFLLQVYVFKFTI